MYPALATAQALLRKKHEGHQLYFIGAVGGLESGLVAASGLDFAAVHAIYAGPLHGVSPLRVLASLFKLKIGTALALYRLRSIRPQVILLTGGWANLPLALAARALRLPIVIFLPDIEPGLTIRALKRFAAVVALTVDESAEYFPRNKTVVTGYPLGESRLTATRAEGRAHFELDETRKTLLVFGGSQGARNINLALGEALPRLLDQGLQIIHITGENDWRRMLEQVGSLAGHPQYRAFAYLHEEMALALAAADLAVCRAGASTLAELPLFGLPAVLAPYPYAWRYQKVNADYLSERGAAICLRDQDLPAQLSDTVLELIHDDERLAQMRACSRALARHDGADALAKLLVETGGG